MNISSLDTVYDYFHFGLLMIQQRGWAMHSWDIHHIENTSGYFSFLFELWLFIEEHLIFMGHH